MSLCPFCGKELAEGQVCDCAESKNAVNATVQEATAQAEAAQTEAVQAEASFEDKFNATAQKVVDKLPESAQGFFKKNGKYIGIGVAALIVLILLISLCSSAGGSYKDPINDVVKQVNKGKKADLVELYTAGYPSDLKKVTKKMYALLDEDEMEDLEEDLADDFEDLADKYDKWKLSFEIDSVEKLSKTDLSDYKDEYEDIWDDYLEDFVDQLEDFDDDDLEDIAEMLDVSEKDLKSVLKSYSKYAQSFKKVKISKGYEVKGRYILKNGRDEIDKTDKATIIVLKVNGEWVIDSVKKGSGFYFSDTSSKNYKKYSFISNYLNNYFRRGLKGLDDLF